MPFIHDMDLLPTFSKIIGGKLPTDRVIDGIDQTDFFLGKQKNYRQIPKKPHEPGFGRCRLW